MANEFVIKNGYFSQENSNVTGSLRVSGSIGVIGSGSDVLSVYGSQGNLLVVNDTFSGSIFTVTDISGYPILDVTSDYYTSSINTIGFLNHTGSARITGSLIVSGGFIVHDPAIGYSLIDALNTVLIDTAGITSISWAGRELIDGNGNPSLAWGSSTLLANDGSTTHIDWSNTSYMNFTSTTENTITRVLGMDNSNNVYWTSSTAIGGGGSTFNSTSSFLGNDSDVSFNINHGFNTLNLHITVYSASGTYETVYPDIRRINANTASIVFANPPASNEYIVYISQ